MKSLFLTVFACAAAAFTAAQQPPVSPDRVGGATSFVETSNLPVSKFGPEDLIGVTVYDSPELTRTYRIEADGTIRLPMVRKRVVAAGLLPEELETSISKVLTDDGVLVEPIVMVTVVEYRSRPVTVVGAVRNPGTFQIAGAISLLEAITRAGGLTDNAGTEILVSHQANTTGGQQVRLTERIPIRSLLSTEDPASNITLGGGENIRIPEAGRLYVVGSVKHPGVFTITDGSETSVMKAMALSEGLDSFSAHTAYIYRLEGGNGGRNEIPIELKKIMDRKVPDVALQANDILYVPDASGRRLSAKVLGSSLGIALGTASLILYAVR